MTNFFPPDVFSFPNHWELVRQAPHKLLEMVGKEIVEKSSGLLGYRIKRRVENRIWLDFYVTAPTLEDFELLLCIVSYEMNGAGYPCQLNNWENKPLSPLAAGNKSKTTEIPSFLVLKETMQRFLGHESTKYMVTCLYFHAKNAQELTNGQTT